MPTLRFPRPPGDEMGLVSKVFYINRLRDCLKQSEALLADNLRRHSRDTCARRFRRKVRKHIQMLTLMLEATIAVVAAERDHA